MSVGSESLLRELSPRVLAALLRRGAGFSDAEDAVQEALLEAATRWPLDGVPDGPAAWLITVAWRKLLDAVRSAHSRRRREDLNALRPEPGAAQQSDDTLQLFFLCCHPVLSTPSAVSLTLRAVGGLTTRQIAAAYLLPETTVAQRISRAKKELAGRRLDQPGDLGTVLRVLYLIFNEGYTAGPGRADLAAEAIHLTRLLREESDEPEVAGLLALMLLHHARRDARTDPAGALVALADQDRARWDAAMITAGVAVLQGALAVGRSGEYQIQAAIAALHDDARSAVETDWVQILSWYDDLVALTGNPIASLNRAVALGEVDGPLVALRELDAVQDRLAGHHRLDAVRAHLLERAGDTARAGALFVTAARTATSEAERDHLLRRAAAAGCADRKTT